MSELPRSDGNPNQDELYQSFTPDAPEQTSPSPEAGQHETPKNPTEAAIDILGGEVDAIRDRLDSLPQVIREAVQQVVQPLIDRVETLEQSNRVVPTPSSLNSHPSLESELTTNNRETIYEADEAAYEAFQTQSNGEAKSDDEAYNAHIESRRREHGAKMEQAIFEGNNPLARQAYLLAQLAADKRTALDAGILKGEIAEDSDRARVLREDIGYVDGKIADLLHKAETEQAIDILGGKRIAVTPISKEVSDFIMDAAVESPVFEIDPASEEPSNAESSVAAASEEGTVETPNVSEGTTAETTQGKQSNSEKAREIAISYDLSDPVQMGKYRAALEEAGIDTSGKDAEALKKIVEGSEDFQQNSAETEELAESENAKPTQEASDNEERENLEDQLAEAKENLEKAKTKGVFGFERGSQEEADVIANLEAKIADIEARLNPTETSSEADNVAAEVQLEDIEALNEAAKKVLAENRELELRGLHEGIAELKTKELELRGQGKIDEADSVSNEIIALQNRLAALEAEQVSHEAKTGENLSPNLDRVEPSPEADDVIPQERAKRNWFMRKVDWAKAKGWQLITRGQANVSEARDEATVAAHGDKYDEYVKSIYGKEARAERYENEARDELRDRIAFHHDIEDPSTIELNERHVAKVVKDKERKFQKSIENTGWNHIKNLAREIRRPINQEGLTDEEYQDAKSHKRKVIIGAVAIGAPVIIAGTLLAAKGFGAFDHLASGAEAHTFDEVSSNGMSNPRDHMTADQFRDFKGLDPQQQHDTSYPPLTELDPQPGDYNADNIDVEYGDYLSADKVSDYAMGTHLDMASSDTAINGLFDRAEGGPDQAAQMSNLLTNEQVEHFGFAGLTPQQIEERLHDDALRADVLNTINADYENGSATTSVLTADDLRQLEGKVDNFYNWGAKPIDANGNEISIEQARAQGITDTELVQYQISLQELIDRGASLLKVTNADGETVYFNSLCQNMLTEIPRHDVPIVEEPHHPVEPPTPTEPTHPTEPTLPPEPTPTEPTHPTEPTLPPEPTPTEPTHPTEPTLPPEPTPTPPVTPEPKDPNEDINVNPDLPDQVEVTDPVDSGDHQPEDTVTTPPDDYVEPTPEPSHETAPEAEPVAPDVREDEVQDAPKADDANGPVDPGTQEQLEESGAGQLEGGQGNDGRVEG